MEFELGNDAFNLFQMSAVTVDQPYTYIEGCETDSYLHVVSVKPNKNVHSAHEAEIESKNCLEQFGITDFAHFDNETVIAAVEEISDGEQKQEIESVIEVINDDDVKFSEYVRYCSKVQKGHRRRRWSELQNSHRSASMSEQLIDTSVNNRTANIMHRKPKKRLFAHR